ncbi:MULTISPECIES: hypothetical protein [Comamonas]|jgi:hypothetical protein|uniref:hypothetical protein n=1 Tax=Comamonas TaxID=283 RepID=UPI0012C66897|nr:MULTISPECIES: hypothetical protein [Comamonas]MDR3067846.1 hypothetical protein [Comamonas sp.]MEB5966953.1 hypothetical protein [Comamonas testosteroni]MPS95611.1 hypothetical protein [Comamonas sp.]
MGFAASMQSWTRRTLNSLSSSHPLTPDLRGGQAGSAGAETTTFKTHRPKVSRIRIPVMRANRSRSRLGSGTLSPQTLTAPPPARSQGTEAASVRLLKIVQREPRKQPECLLISGRMADVCAALERMALHEQTARQA